MSKTWPSDPKKTANFSEILDPLVNAVKATHKIERIEGIGYDWDGLPNGDRESPISVDPNERLTAKYLDWQANYNDNSALEIILTLAIQLGIEQGRRLDRSSN